MMQLATIDDGNLGDLGLSWPSSVSDVVNTVEELAKYRTEAEAVLRGDISSVTQQAIERALPEYERRVRAYDPWLERQGRRAVRVAAAKLIPIIVPKPPASEEQNDKQPSAPTWMDRLVDPVKDPVLRGAKDEAIKIAKPVLIKVGIIAAVTMAAVFVLGRASKTCS